MGRPLHRTDVATRLAAAAAVAGGVLVLIGWQLDIRILKQPMADASSMRATTATMLAAAGTSLWLLATNKLSRLVVVLGSLIGVTGLLSLGHIVFGPDFAIDRLWLSGEAPSGRMSPLTAFCFAVLGPALAVCTRKGYAWTAHLLALLAMLVVTIVSIGYLYKVSDLLGIGMYTTMAPHTAALLLAVSVGLLCLKPAEGVMAVLCADTLGGTMARRTLPATIGIPVALGWLRLAGDRAGLYNPLVGPPLVVVGSMVLVSIVIWLNAKLLDKVDAKRHAAEDELRRSHEALEARIAEKTAEVRATEARLRAGQRLEAMGHLAGGVAHDFNNMMTVVSGYSELLLGQVPPGHPTRKALQEIKKAGDRCANLTGHLLAFSRRQILAPAVIDLNAVVADLSNMLPVLLGEKISVATTADPNLWRVRADPSQIEQVIVNLVVNARDAMPRGGRLTIETLNVEAGRSTEPDHAGLPPEPYVMLRLADTGHGMDADTRSRAFDPFFTTKPAGQGTGFGLSTAYGVITQSNGHIFVDSAPGSGATFRIYLPRVEAPLTPMPAATAGPPPRGQETVLLVDDEEALRRFLKDVLETAGYTVLEAAEPGQVVSLGQQFAGPIHLLLTDIVMAGMSGGELAERFHHLRPEASVLLMSGYAQEAVVQDTVNATGATFLQKPFAPDALLTRVREVLDAQALADRVQ